MTKQVRLPLNNRDVSRFFNNSVYNRSIKLWVGNTCFTCSRLILAQHSSVFEQHLRDSPSSVLLDGFTDVERASDGIQDALILLYGGLVTVNMRNIQVLSRFAVIYNIKELIKVTMEFIRQNLGVENIMLFFKALKTVDREGVVEIPDIVRKFMEEKTAPIVDHLLSSSDGIDDEFLLAMLELPSSSVLVQRCLKSGVLPDPIVELIFKHSSTINVNFLLHDDKRTYVRLITVLKSKARSYKDMEKIIDIQQKCISKMCHPYGSLDSLVTPAPSIAPMAPSSNTDNRFRERDVVVRREQERGVGRREEERGGGRREEYHPKSLEGTNRRPPPFQPPQSSEDSEYLLPEELKRSGNNSRFAQEFREDNRFREGEGNDSNRFQGNHPERGNNIGGDNRDRRPVNDFSSVPNHHPAVNRSSFRATAEERQPFPDHDSSQDTEPSFPTSYGRPREEPPPEKSFTTKRNQDSRMPPSVVAQLKHNLEKNFVAKYPGDALKVRAADNNRPSFDDGSDAETYLEDRGRDTGLANGMRGMSMGRKDRERPLSEEHLNTTDYAQVYMKKAQLRVEEDNRLMEKVSASARHEAQGSLKQQDDMMAALNKLAEQQAIIEHTYDNMSLSGRVGHNKSPQLDTRRHPEPQQPAVAQNSRWHPEPHQPAVTHDSRRHPEPHQPAVAHDSRRHPEPHHPPPAQSRNRSDSGPRKAATSADGITDFEEEIPAVRVSEGSRHNSGSSSARQPIHIPTTFGTTGSARASARSTRPPTPPNNPPPGSTSFFATGAQEAKPREQSARPPPTLQVPPPPAPEPAPGPELLNLEALSGLDSGYPSDMPLDILPDHDRMMSPPMVMSPPMARANLRAAPADRSFASSRTSRPMSPTFTELSGEREERGRARAPAWNKPNKILIPNLRNETQVNLSPEELLQQSSVLLTKRSKSRSKERTKSKERKSMRKKKNKEAAQKLRDMTYPDKGDR